MLFVQTKIHERTQRAVTRAFRIRWEFTALIIAVMLVAGCATTRPDSAMATALQAVNDMRFSPTLADCPQLGREAEDEIRQMHEAFDRHDDRGALAHANRAQRLAEQVKSCRPEKK